MDGGSPFVASAARVAPDRLIDCVFVDFFLAEPELEQRRRRDEIRLPARRAHAPDQPLPPQALIEIGFRPDQAATVTPYLPKAAEVDANAWVRSGKPAFVKAFEKARNDLACPNCQGVGFVMLNLAISGPHSSPSP